VAARRCEACGEAKPHTYLRRDVDQVLCSTCRSRQVAAARDAEQLEAIVVAVADIEPAIALDTIRGCAYRAARNRRERTLLARLLLSEPHALTIGDSTPPIVVDRLVTELLAVGAQHVRLPVCCVCGQSDWLTQRLEGLRLCSLCCGRRRVEPCIVCGHTRRIGKRNADGTATCERCWHRDPAQLEPCAECHRARRAAKRLPDGGALCETCLRRITKVRCTTCGELRTPVTGVRDAAPRCASCARRRDRCAGCGRVATIPAVFADGPRCSTCYEKQLLAKAPCEQCGQLRRPDPRRPGRVVCAQCAGLEPFQVCLNCGDETKLYETGRCRRCALTRRVDSVLATAGEPLPAPLAALRASLVEVDNPKAGLKWLARKHNLLFLTRVAAGEIELNHEALDELGPAGHVGHLRAVLVAAGALPDREERVAGLERWIGEHVASIDPAEDRHLIDTYATWWQLRRSRQRVEYNKPISPKQVRRRVMVATELLAWLREQRHVGLDGATQADVDAWAGRLSGSRRRSAHDFLRWANKRKLTTLTIVRAPAAIPTADPTLADDERIALTRRFLSDATIPTSDRVAGLLVVLYAQPLARIVALTIDDVGIDDGAITIRFGADAIVVAEPLDRLLLDLAGQRKGHASVASDTKRWLFPGGRPGCHLCTDRLSKRLRKHGLTPGVARTNTLLDLAADTPLVVMAELLGMHPNTAARWIRAAGGDWTRYTADRLHDQAAQQR